MYFNLYFQPRLHPSFYGGRTDPSQRYSRSSQVYIKHLKYHHIINGIKIPLQALEHWEIKHVYLEVNKTFDWIMNVGHLVYNNMYTDPLNSPYLTSKQLLSSFTRVEGPKFYLSYLLKKL